jgi:hypothetical protein
MDSCDGVGYSASDLKGVGFINTPSLAALVEKTNPVPGINVHTARKTPSSSSVNPDPLRACTVSPNAAHRRRLSSAAETPRAR